MQNDVSAYIPVGYDTRLVTVALVCAVMLVIWYGYVIWTTRHRIHRNIANLPPLEPTVVDIEVLRAKYMTLIAEVESAHTNGQIQSRAVHQKLSVLLRFFAQEAHGLRAYSLTLSDLRRTRYNQLTAAIESYYVPEFHEVIEGDVPNALNTAREVVSTWS